MRWMLLALLGWGCAPEPPTRPTPPDLTGVLAQYVAPSGTVNRDSARRLLEEGAMALALVQSAGVLIEFFGQIFSDLGGAVESDAQGLVVQRRGLEVGGVDLNAGAWVVYHRLCPTANGMGERGEVALTALIEETGIEPTIWGRLQDCRANGSTLDSDIAMHVTWTDGAPQSVLARFDGVVKLGEAQQTGVFTVRWDAGAVLTRYALDDGAFLLGIDTANGAVMIVGENGRFACNEAGCTGPEGGFAW